KPPRLLQRCRGRPILSSMAVAEDDARQGLPLRVGFILRAFRSRNYRLYFAGQLISMMGTWLTIVATSWLVYQIARRTMPNRESMILGLVSFSAQIPIFLIAPFAGVWVDRLNCHRI